MIRLLQLPDEFIQNVLKIFTCVELFAFSLCSNRTKRLIKSAIQYKNSITVDVHSEFNFMAFAPSMTKFSLVNQEGSDDLGKLVPCNLSGYCSRDESTLELTRPGFGVRDWLDHVSFILNYPMINIRFGPLQNWKYTIESVQDVLKGLAIGDLILSGINDDICEILRLFPTRDSLLLHYLGEQPEEELSDEEFQFIRKTLIGNLTEVSLRFTIPLDLDFLLTINSHEIESCGSKLSDKDLNMFLRLWLRGSNPRLEYLLLSHYDPSTNQGQPRDLNERVIFKGIKYEKKSEDEKRKIDRERYVNSWFEFTGGFDIRRRDRTVATIFLNQEHHNFQMFVWP